MQLRDRGPLLEFRIKAISCRRSSLQPSSKTVLGVSGSLYSSPADAGLSASFYSCFTVQSGSRGRKQTREDLETPRKTACSANSQNRILGWGDGKRFWIPTSKIWCLKLSVKGKIWMQTSKYREENGMTQGEKTDIYQPGREDATAPPPQHSEGTSPAHT